MKTAPMVKICGLTDPNNALACVHAGADTIGLVFYSKSPRNVSPSRAARITQALPPFIITCGVFVNEGFDQIMEVKTRCRLRAVQLHGQESPGLVADLIREGLMVFKALFAGKSPGLDQAAQYPEASAFLIEWGKGPLPGGNAETWDYTLSKKISAKAPILLAGGLSPDNVRKAISKANPWGVDVSSGVEASPGVKDIQKVKRFIQQAKTLSP